MGRQELAGRPGITLGHFPGAGMTRIRFGGCDLSPQAASDLKAPLVVIER